MNVYEMNRISNSFQDGSTKGTKVESSVQTAKEGNISSVIFDTTRDCDVQKEMESSIVYGKQLHKQEISTDVKNARLLSMDYIATSLTGEDVASLENEETPLGGYDSSQIDQAISRIKEQRDSTQESIDRQVAKEHDQMENVEEQAKVAALMQKLANAALPPTPENVARLTCAVDMCASIDSLSSMQKLVLLQTQSPVTPEKVSQSNGVKPYQQKMDDSFELIAPQVEKILTDASMEVTPERMEAAKDLYENHLPVTPERILAYQQIDELAELSPEVLLDRIVDGMADGYSAQNVDLTMPSKSEAKEKVNELLSTTDEKLATVYTKEADLIHAKRQLEEVRLRMTVQAARQMMKQGIEIDVKNLSDVVENLKMQESQAYQNIFEQADIPQTDENMTIMQDVFSLKEQIASAPAAVLGATLERGMTQTLDEFTTEVKNIGIDLGEQYEKVGTQVRTDLGDRISKAFQNVDEILDDLKLPRTAENQRAVRILGYNQMEITKEQIGEVKEYDTKVNQMIRQMKPEAVAGLVRKGINPMDLSMEELTQELGAISDRIEESDISYEKFIWKMDQQGKLTAKERKSMIGIYRLLDKVEKSDGAVVGALVKENRSITLSSLLSAVRSKKAQGIDVDIDDSFGTLTETKVTGESISDQIGAAYGEKIVHSLKQHLSPEVLSSQEDLAMDLPLSTLYELCNGMDEADFYEEMANEIRQTMSDCSDAQAFLDELEMPATLENLMTARNYLKHGSHQWEEKIDLQMSQNIVDHLDEEDALNQALNQAEEQVMTKVQTEIEEKETNGEVESQDIKILSMMSRSISFYRKMRERKMYEIPVVTEQGITTMNVTIQQGEKERGVARITMNSKEFGTCQASFELNGMTVNGLITSENADQREQLQGLMDQVKENLQRNGFEVQKLVSATGNRTSIKQNLSENVSTKALYQVAKIFVQNIQRRGESYED